MPNCYQKAKQKKKNKQKSTNVSTHTYAVSGNIPFSTKTPSILLMPAFFAKKTPFFAKYGIFTQSNGLRAVVLKIFQFCFQFL